MISSIQTGVVMLSEFMAVRKYSNLVCLTGKQKIIYGVAMCTLYTERIIIIAP